MPGRQFNANSYKYGFNGRENDKETVGTGSGTQDYGARIYNPALGKFLSVDPLSKSYPWNSCYAFAENTPIAFIDLDGQEKYHYSKTIQDGATVFTIIGKEDLVERTYSIEWNGWMPKIVYTTHTNERKEFITHQESDGTIENFDKVQFVKIDETTTYSSQENMINDVDGDSGNEKLWHLASKGLQNVNEENATNGNGGGGLNWSRAITRTSKIGFNASKILSKDIEHIFSKDHIRGGIMSLGKDKGSILKNIQSTVNKDLKNLKEGNNFIFKKMNGVDATIKVQVKKGEVISLDAHVNNGKQQVRHPDKVNIIKR